jgi:membrane protein DedA with SNARE-associated domain
LDSWAQWTLDYISAHREWTFPIALVFAFAENLVFLSIAIPSTAILVGVGAFVASGSINFLPLWLGAALGAVLGSTFSYWLGRLFGPYILKAWPLRNFPDYVDRGFAAFRDWGLWAIAIGHFVGPLRAVVFLLAGMTGIRFLPFMAVNVPVAMFWAFIVPLFGELMGLVIGWIWRILGL